MFGSTSRYATLPDLSFEDEDGEVHVYKARRFPPIATPFLMSSVQVRDGERLDNLTARTLGDPLAFWRIADANGAMDPFDLMVPGARLVIPAVSFDGRGCVMTTPASIKLLLMTGPLIPAPAPLAVVEKLQSVQVTCSADGPSSFQLRFNADRAQGLTSDFALLIGSSLQPWNRITLGVSLGGAPVTLIDGFITHQELSHDKQFGAASLTVTGEDVSILMDRLQISFQYPQMGDSEIALAVLAKYSLIGIAPMVIPTEADLVPTMVERVPEQNSTDRAYLTSLAQPYGYKFYVRPGPVPLTNTAYWGPPLRIGAVKPALSMDLGSSTNIDKVSFRLDSSSTTQPFGMVQDDISELDLPLAVVLPSRLPPLAAVPAFNPLSPYQKRDLFTDPRYGYIESYLEALATTDMSTDDVVTVDGELETSRYCAILDIPGVVDVRGAGWSYDGRYVVRQVTHSIQRGTYKQSFKLSREGTGSTETVVAP